jgi:hypothetical protein
MAVGGVAQGTKRMQGKRKEGRELVNGQRLLLHCGQSKHLSSWSGVKPTAVKEIGCSKGMLGVEGKEFIMHGWDEGGLNNLRC